MPYQKIKRAASASELSDEELLTILLKVPSAHTLAKVLRGRGNLPDLDFRTIAAAIKDYNEKNPLDPIKGISEKKLMTLAAAFELAKRVDNFTEYDFRTVNLRSSAAAFRVFLAESKRRHEQEVFFTLPMDSDFHPLCRPIPIHKGSVNNVMVSPRDVFCEAIRWRAYAIIVAHNHPSGDLTPSEEDLKLTEDLLSIGRLHKIPLIDHLIIGDPEAEKPYTSIRSLGLLNFSNK